MTLKSYLSKTFVLPFAADIKKKALPCFIKNRHCFLKLKMAILEGHNFFDNRWPIYTFNIHVACILGGGVLLFRISGGMVLSKWGSTLNS
jgi:hypothetical protein